MEFNRAVLLEAVIEPCAGDGEEDEDTAPLDRLDAELPHSDISDLIFHGFRDLAPEQVAGEAPRREQELAARRRRPTRPA